MSKPIDWETAFRRLAKLAADDWSPGGETERDNGAGYPEAVMTYGLLDTRCCTHAIEPEENLHDALVEALKDVEF